MARVLVLGGYGLIGADVARRLTADGHEVRAVGRDGDMARTVLPTATWIKCDLATLLEPSDWTALLAKTDFVVNCAGALQPSQYDDLDAVHDKMVSALADACRTGDVGLIQISAVGADTNAPTEFLASKGRGDAAIQDAVPRHWILRPGLVLAGSGYGGTQLLRMLAAVPFVQPVAFAQAQVQTVSVNDVSRCVSLAVSDEIAPRSVVDLVEAAPQNIEAVMTKIRAWLGFPAPWMTLRIPTLAVGPVARLADGLGRLGWRSPMRTTAMSVLARGVTGSPAEDITGPIATLDQTLAANPARFEDRVSARMALLMPVVVGVLSAFWLFSGLIGLISLRQAADVLVAIGWSDLAAQSAVVFWSLVDILLGGFILLRHWAKRAALLMVLVSLIYLFASTILTPYMWLDPLGPLVKTIPAIVLALVARALLETR